MVATRATLPALTALACLLPMPAWCALDLPAYELPDGAITIHAGGDVVDPYFAAKALVVAHETGLDIQGIGERWVGWALPRQLSDGRFLRYCRSKGDDWVACMDADADDALLALWMQLLHILSPDAGLPPSWQASVARAQTHLQALRTPAGVYQVSRSNRETLLMDNAEIYGALSAIAHYHTQSGRHPEEAAHWQTEATSLSRAMFYVFWDGSRRLYKSAATPQHLGSFYPEALAQTYVWAASLPSPPHAPSRQFAEWLSAHGNDWLERKRDPHPWGVVAVTAWALGDTATAQRWLDAARPLRASEHWHVLEEAAYLGLQRALALHSSRSSSPGAMRHMDQEVR